MEREVIEYQMNESAATTFMTLSLIILVVSAIYAAMTRPARERGEYTLTSFQAFTFGVFLSVVLLFIPIYYTAYDFGDSVTLLRPFLLSVHHALRVFILDGEFDTIRNAVLPLPPDKQTLFSLYAAVLYVLAPLLTFGMILTLANSYYHRRAFTRSRSRPCYIFSELNSRSVVLAESIVAQNQECKRKHRPMIVFTDVFPGKEEADYELMRSVHRLKAICLKQDITGLKIRKKKQRVEFFLVGSDESENVEQTISLIVNNKEDESGGDRKKENRNRENNKAVSIYLYSFNPGAGYILDSLDKGTRSLEPSVIDRIVSDPKAFLEDPEVKTERIDCGLFVRRIDILEALAQRTLTDPEVQNNLFIRSLPEKTVSVLILGLGRCGTEFLRNALWLYQIDGYRLEINVVDASVAHNGAPKSIRKTLGHLWPGVIDDPEKDSFVREESGFAHYDIRFFENVDCFTSDFDRLFIEPESADRLRRTQLAIVSLGNDDRNIEAAVSLRVLFDRLNGISNQTIKARKAEGCSAAETPMICSVVYDQKKADNLKCARENGGLVNYQGVSYGIHFIGSLQSQYDYKKIKQQNGLELEALRHHLDWQRKDAEKKGVLKEEEKQQLVQDVLRTTKAYMDYEYYRKSSMGSALHEALLADIGAQLKDLSETGRAASLASALCKNAPVSEHMRWNVYMLTQGYEYAAVRADRAKLHPDILSRSEIDPLDKPKDRIDKQLQPIS